jgi:hypothetical protein
MVVLACFGRVFVQGVCRQPVTDPRGDNCAQKIKLHCPRRACGGRGDGHGSSCKGAAGVERILRGGNCVEGRWTGGTRAWVENETWRRRYGGSGEVRQAKSTACTRASRGGVGCGPPSRTDRRRSRGGRGYGTRTSGHGVWQSRGRTRRWRGRARARRGG